jgi:hypothetical protein
MINPTIELPMEPIAAFCHKWHVTELALFGSVLNPIQVENFSFEHQANLT